MNRHNFTDIDYYSQHQSLKLTVNELEAWNFIITSLALLHLGRVELLVWHCHWVEQRRMSGGRCLCRLHHTCWDGEPAPCAGGSSAHAHSSETPVHPPTENLRCPSNAEHPVTGCWEVLYPPQGPWSHASGLHTPPKPLIEQSMMINREESIIESYLI